MVGESYFASAVMSNWRNVRFHGILATYQVPTDETQNVMSMFSKQRFLGVDFGTASIKAVELEMKNGAPELINYGEAALLAPESGRSGVPVRSFKEDMVLRFRALLERMDPGTRDLAISMPSFLGLISLIDFADMTDAELEESVKFEAHKYIPSPLEDVALSWEKLSVKEVPLPDGTIQKKTEVLLVAALNKEVWQYEGYVRAVGYDMKLLELETFSIARSIVGDDPGTFLVIDIGARAANLILVEGGLVKMSRNIDAGGRDITRTLAEGLNISVERAEILKKSQKDFLNAREASIIFPAIEMTLNEADRMIDSWKTKWPDAHLDGVILSGGTARLTGFAQYASSKLGVPAILGDPWRNIVCPTTLQSMIEKLGPSFSVAIGLALYGMKDKK